MIYKICRFDSVQLYGALGRDKPNQQSMHLTEIHFLIIMNALVFANLCYWSNVWCNTIEPNLNKVKTVQN